jgi:hypothetical protein
MEYPIPPASLARLRATYEQFTQLVQIVGEAMQLERVDGIDLPKGVMVVQDAEPELLGQTTMPEAPNGTTDHLLDGTLAR